MPPKRKIQKDEILIKAYDMVRKEGFENLSARKLAKELQCSTQPIYQVFSDMNDLKKSLTGMAQKELFQRVLYSVEDNIPKMVSAILAYIDFAGKEKHLYQLIFASGGMILPEEKTKEDSNRGMPGLDMIIYANGIIMMQAFGALQKSKDEIKGMVLTAYEKLQEKNI